MMRHTPRGSQRTSEVEPVSVSGVGVGPLTVDGAVHASDAPAPMLAATAADFAIDRAEVASNDVPTA